MSYYNPKIYNFSNLKDEDKKVVRWMLIGGDNFELTLDEVELEFENLPLISEILKEIYKDSIEKVRNNLVNNVIEFMVASIDNYEENYQIDESTKGDYFEGLDIECWLNRPKEGEL